MTPEQTQQLKELYEWMQQRKVQQLSYPVDDASRNSLGVPVGNGTGSTTKTQALSLTGNAQNINVPAAYAQTFLLVVDGVRYEVPSLI